ncbi:ABC transporter permease [Desulfurivibrio dismutans]|uniref:ABC transporter permease n=1 Tax=Desulfurivibrio dismutans TaxID=1398908 RepID=UPI0023DC308F|nr:FtsX-like permease family protein [Desulfurivibrio alkaliphilus]MDF1615536.1 FtsX-like permease family protein [Desulfurivibrio alkaliphilus]
MKCFLAKQFNLLDFAFSSLWRRRLKNGAVLLVFAGVIFLVASFHLATTALTATAERLLASAPDIVIQNMAAGRQESVPLAYEQELGGLFGIKKVVPRIWGYYFDEIRGANFTVLGVDPARMPLGEHLGQTLAVGVFPGAGVSGEGAAAGNAQVGTATGDGAAEPVDQVAAGVAPAVLGSLVSASLEVGKGDYFSLFRPDLSLKTFAVSGLFRADGDLLSGDLIALHLDEARDLFQIPSHLATDLCVYVYNPAEINNMARRIAEALPDTRVLTREQIQRTYQAVFGWRSGFAAVLLLAALAAFVILAWDKASGLSPEERREVAILKIVGWETPDVLALRCWEALLVAGFAFLLGVIGAWIHVVYFDAGLFRPVMVGWSVIHPGFALVPRIEAQDVLLLFSLTVLPYLAATVIPTWRCASVPAEDAL